MTQFVSQRFVSRASVWTFVLALAVLAGGVLSAQDEKPAAKRKAPRGRLPTHYAKVVSPDQREKIYGIQKEYAPKVKELRDQLQALLAERDAKCREVLTPEQQKKVDELTAAAKAARDADKAADEADDGKPTASSGGK